VTLSNADVSCNEASGGDGGRGGNGTGIAATGGDGGSAGKDTQGGGIFAAHVDAENSTVNKNNASGGDGGTGGTGTGTGGNGGNGADARGGGIYVTGSANLTNTEVAYNIAAGGDGGDGGNGGTLGGNGGNGGDAEGGGVFGLVFGGNIHDNHVEAVAILRERSGTMYDPRIVVRALVPRERLMKRYHRAWHSGHGRFYALMRDPSFERSGLGSILGVPAHVYRAAADGVAAAVCGSATAPPSRAFARELALPFSAGFIRERIAQPTNLQPRAGCQRDTRLAASVIIPFASSALARRSIMTAIRSSHSFSRYASAAGGQAWLTRMSRRPNAPSTSATSRAGSETSARSPVIGTARRPARLTRAQVWSGHCCPSCTATSAPASASATATAAPSPL